MAERITPPPYWWYDAGIDGEEAVIIKVPERGTRDGGTGGWSYGYTPKVGDKVRVIANRDNDHEVSIEFPEHPEYGEMFIYEQCIEPVNIPIPEDVDLSKPEDIEKWLEDA